MFRRRLHRNKVNSFSMVWSIAFAERNSQLKRSKLADAIWVT